MKLDEPFSSIDLKCVNKWRQFRTVCLTQRIVEIASHSLVVHHKSGQVLWLEFRPGRRFTINNDIKFSGLIRFKGHDFSKIQVGIVLNTGICRTPRESPGSRIQRRCCGSHGKSWWVKVVLDISVEFSSCGINIPLWKLKSFPNSIISVKAISTRRNID